MNVNLSVFMCQGVILGEHVVTTCLSTIELTIQRTLPFIAETTKIIDNNNKAKHLSTNTDSQRETNTCRVKPFRCESNAT